VRQASMRIIAGNGNWDVEKASRQEHGGVPCDGIGAIADVQAGG
jgi:hypothetical protein